MRFLALLAAMLIPLCAPAKAATLSLVGSVQQLRGWPLAAMASTKNVEAQSYHANLEDGGGGMFKFTTWTSGTPNPDGNIVIAPADHRGSCASGCMVRQDQNGRGIYYNQKLWLNGVITPSMFGAVCNKLPGQSAADSTAALQAALNFVPAGGGEIDFPCLYNASSTLKWVITNGQRGLTLRGTASGDVNSGGGIVFTGNNKPILILCGYLLDVEHMFIGYANPQWWVGTASASGTNLTVESTTKGGGALQAGMALHSYKHNVGSPRYTTYEGATVLRGTGPFVLNTSLGTVATENMTAGFTASQAILLDQVYKSKFAALTINRAYDAFAIMQAGGLDRSGLNWAFDNHFEDVLIQDAAHTGFYMLPYTPKHTGDDNNNYENVYIRDTVHNVHQLLAGWFLENEEESVLVNDHIEWVDASSAVQATNAKNLFVTAMHLEGVDWLADNALNLYQGWVGPFFFSTCVGCTVQAIGFYANTFDADAVTTAVPLLFGLNGNFLKFDGAYETGTRTNAKANYRAMTFPPGDMSGLVDFNHALFSTPGLWTKDNLYGSAWTVRTNGKPAVGTYEARNKASPAKGDQYEFTDATVTGGTIEAGSGTHDVIGIYNGSSWQVLFVYR